MPDRSRCPGPPPEDQSLEVITRDLKAPSEDVRREAVYAIYDLGADEFWHKIYVPLVVRQYDLSS